MNETIHLSTLRLNLRPVRNDDFDSWAAMLADPEATRSIGGPKSRLEAWNMFRAVGGAWHFDGHSCFSIFEKASGRWVGCAGVLRREELRTPESVAGIVSDRWRRGYVVEALTAVLDWTFDRFGFDEVISYVPSNHVISRNAARKLGATYRGLARLPASLVGEELPAEVWVINREEWLLDRSSDVIWAPRYLGEM